MATVLKYLYLARRHPSLTRAAFVDRWRQHGTLAMSTRRWAHIRRYAQCDALPLNLPGLANDGYDGVGIVQPWSPAARLAYRTDADAQELLERDEAQTFAAPVLSCSVMCDEQVQLDDARPAPVKLVRFLAPGPDFDAMRFERNWAAHRDALHAGARAWGLRRHLLDRPMPPERESGWGLQVTAIEELFFADLDALVRTHAALTTGELPGFAGVATLSLATNEVVLHDRTAPAPDESRNA